MLRDAPAGGRPVLVRWRKRIWMCPDTDCDTRTWTEQAALAAPRAVLTTRAAAWATDRVEALEGTPASIARCFGVSWSTVWACVSRLGGGRVDDLDRVGVTEMVGFDETVMQPAARRRRRRFVTAVVDVATGQILDVFEGRDAKHLRVWLASLPPLWLAGIRVVSVDPHEGYRSAVINPDPATGEPSPLRFASVTVVVDPFHIVRLGNQAVTKCRQRVQQETLEHRGWKGDPLYDLRKLLLMGAERVDLAGWERIHRARSGAGARHPREDVASLAWADSRPTQHRRVERSGRSSEPTDQGRQALGPRLSKCGQLPAPHPSRRRPEPAARDSHRHATSTPPSQVDGVGPSKVGASTRPAALHCLSSALDAGTRWCTRGDGRRPRRPG